MIVSSVAAASAGASGNDGLALVPVGEAQVLIVADGAQGRQGGMAADIATAYVTRHAATRLVDSVRLPTRRLHDDVTVCVLGSDRPGT